MFSQQQKITKCTDRLCGFHPTVPSFYFRCKDGAIPLLRKEIQHFKPLALAIDDTLVDV